VVKNILYALYLQSIVIYNKKSGHPFLDTRSFKIHNSFNAYATPLPTATGALISPTVSP